MNQTTDSSGSDILILGQGIPSRQAIEDFFAQRHGVLTLQQSGIFRAADGTKMAITFANKNPKRDYGWLNVNEAAMKALEESSGWFAFAYYDCEEQKGYFFEVPMSLIAQSVRKRGLKLFGQRYSLYIVHRSGAFRLRNIDLDIQDYLVHQVSLHRDGDTAGDTAQGDAVEPDDDSNHVTYTAEQFLAETYLTRETLDDLEALLTDRKQIILYGPPGTGKTYVAQKLARYFVGGDESRIQLIQFHPSYSYEEFIEGIRPEARDDGPPTYPVRQGMFSAFCEEAAQRDDGRFVMIIDEINRGNIAKIFGELMFLLEYRDSKVPLPYSGNSFSIPNNVYLIGTMNTADRSIALVDFALRRRFHFVPFGADRSVLVRWIEANGAPLPYLMDLFDEVNRAIEDQDYQIGFSYFMRPEMTVADLGRIWRYSIEPYLEECFFDNRAKVNELRWNSLIARFGSRI